MNNLNDFQSFKCGYVAIIGEPNVGKSTLMNAILGTKLSIVTRKPQTTRRQILGFHNSPEHQIIFVDTPGLIKPRYALQETMVESAHRAIRESDVLLILLDAEKSINRENLFPEGLFELVKNVGKPTLILVNKSDIIREKKSLLPLIDRLFKAYGIQTIIPISALQNDGIETVLEEIEKALPFGPPFFPLDILSDQPERFFVSEIIREKIFEKYREEVPYATEVQIVEYKVKEDIDYIAAEIIVERESQRRILIGSKGDAIKGIGVNARKEIEEFLGRKVYLDLHVKIRAGWRNSEEWIRRLGYR